MYKKIMLFLFITLLSSCGTYYEPEPVGIGKGVNDLKLSPCACIEVELPHTLPDWFVASI
ncbi:MAG: hypothetical protein IJW75_01740 [Alphaproteobacteria bacterium]|nr:hypothetical protein [Alphaproteobacteria bacterium]